MYSTLEFENGPTVYFIEPERWICCFGDDIILSSERGPINHDWFEPEDLDYYRKLIEDNIWNIFNHIRMGDLTEDMIPEVYREDVVQYLSK